MSNPTPETPQNRLLSANMLIFYRTFLAFVVGYFCTQMLNVIIVATAHHIGLAKAESVVLGVFCSFIFASIYALSCYITYSMRKLCTVILILTSILACWRYLIIA